MAPRLEKLEDASSSRPPFLELQPGDICRGSTGSPTKDNKGPNKREGMSVPLFAVEEEGEERWGGWWK